MSEHLIKALEGQRNAAMNESAINAARASQFEQMAKDLQTQCDALNEKLNGKPSANNPPAELVEEVKAKIKRKPRGPNKPKAIANGADAAEHTPAS